MILLPPLNDSEMSLIDNALQLYLTESKRLAHHHGLVAEIRRGDERIAEERLADQFERQAKQIEELLDYFESDTRDV